MIRRTAILYLSILMLIGAACAAFADDASPVQGLERVETILYGAPQAGGMLPRISQAEKDLFGRELPGSMTERQQALLNYLEIGNQNQPPLLFKLGVAEWITTKRIDPFQPLGSRIINLETTLEGAAQSGALGARVERLIAKLLPSGINMQTVSVPASTVLKARFRQNVTVRTVKKGDKIELELSEDAIISGVLAAPKGSRVFATVTKAQGPRSFGRPSEISVEFQNVEALDGKLTAVYIGAEAKKAMEVDAGTIGAAGASLAGAVLLGPVGLAGGFLVRGSDKQIPAGSLMYVETTEQSNVMGYPIPSTLSDTIEPAPLAPQGGETPAGAPPTPLP